MKAALRLILLGAIALPAQAQNRDPGDDGQTIIVTGQRIEDTRRALEACLARKCPPLEDMAATLAHAENLFIGGDYRKARSIVEKSMGRNDRFARQHPREVATLHRADARISIHLGDGETYRSSTYGAVRALKKGLDDDDPTVLTARFEVAGMLTRLGRADEAGLAYGGIAKDAAEAGMRDLAASAKLRQAWLVYRKLKTSGALVPIEKIAESRDPALQGSRLSALVLLARVDRERGKPEGSERLLKALADAGVKKPTLLWAPPVDAPFLYDGKQGPGGLSHNSRGLSVATDRFEKTWADVGFWVKADGSVSEAEILRGRGPQGWLKPVLVSIGRRIYSPSPDSGGGYRVERYTWTSLVKAPGGSRIPQHAPQGRIEYVDLTPDPPAR
ncbi:MAG: hypothetical protein ACXW27_13795 [Allosphingosinicella sp.]